MSTVPMRPTTDGTFPMQPTTDGTFPMQPTTGLNGTNSMVIGREGRESRKQYKRPLLDIEQRDPINQILTDNYNYLLSNGITSNNRDVNENMDQTLLVWEYINGVNTMPEARTTPPGTAVSVDPPGTRPIFDGGKRRKSRKSRKSRKVRR